ncbi:MAG: hypothetical protein ACI9UK_001388 [Candidatus Krumholzibacteriia bacterium]|jgi:hypothetical protein
MTPDWEIIAHPTGSWLVKAGRVVYAVPPHVGRALQTGTIPFEVSPGDWAELRQALAAALAGDEGDCKRLPPAIWLRLPLIPARVVRILSRVFRPLASRYGLLPLAILGLAGYIHLGLTTSANPLHFTPGFVAKTLAVFLVTAVWHELGHASALARRGYPPGGVGAGLLFVIPVLFADVTAVGALEKEGKLHVDGAGMVFQFGLGGALAVFSRTGIAGPELEVAAWLALSAVVWSLFPFIKSDGYWLVCDALGLIDLETDPHPLPSGRLLWFLRLYRWANVVFLLLVGIGLPLRYYTRISAMIGHVSTDWHRPEIVVPVGIVAVGILGVIWINIARRIVSLVRAAI